MERICITEGELLEALSSATEYTGSYGSVWGEGRTATACAWLRGALKDGPLHANGLFRAAEANGIHRRTLQRAADALNVVKMRKGFAAGSVWTLPAKDESWP